MPGATADAVAAAQSETATAERAEAAEQSVSRLREEFHDRDARSRAEIEHLHEEIRQLRHNAAAADVRCREAEQALALAQECHQFSREVVCGTQECLLEQQRVEIETLQRLVEEQRNVTSSSAQQQTEAAAAGSARDAVQKSPRRKRFDQSART